MTEQKAASGVTEKRLAESLWGTQQVSEFLGVPAATLRAWRSEGGGPRYYKVGRHVRYDPYDLRLFLLSKASDASGEEVPGPVDPVSLPAARRPRRRRDT